MRTRIIPILALLAIVSVTPVWAADSVTASSVLKMADGKEVGTATLTDTPNGVLIAVRFSGLPAGEHAFHIHTVGKCEPPFESAGGHFNPGNRHHGYAMDGGPHAGDLPNLHVPESGVLAVEVLASNARLQEGGAKLLDGDGAALIVHAGADDYRSDPAGNAGGRIACGVVVAGSNK